MPSSGGFIDLRVGHGVRGIGDDSVWPSFTDIMTVIVMVFLMALVIMMVRNFELDRQLVTTVSAREASFRENQGLIDKLNALESRMLGLRQSLGAGAAEREDLRARLLAELARVDSLVTANAALKGDLASIGADRDRLTEQMLLTSENLALAGERVEALLARNVKLNQARGQAEQQIAALSANEVELSGQLKTMSRRLNALEIRSSSEIENLSRVNLSLSEQLDEVASQLDKVQALLRVEQQQRQQLNALIAAQGEELRGKQDLLARLQASQQQSSRRHAEASAEIDKLNQLIGQRQAENADLQKLANAAGVQFRSLQEEYDSLDEKYRSLARPARSPAGKYVVDVWFLKNADGYRYRLKEPSMDNPAEVDKAALTRRLASIKNQHGKNLYARVVIPENSGLSHNEAWRFTQEILQSYDYYHQPSPRQQPPGDLPAAE